MANGARRIPNYAPLYPPTVSHRNFRELFDGDRIGGGLKLRPAPYLPVLETVDYLYTGIVIKQGTFVTLDQDGYVVPAFVGKKNLTYTAKDVELGVIDIDTGEPVTAPKTSTKTIGTDADADVKIGKPIGILAHDAYVYYPDNQMWQLQYELSIVCDRAVLLGVDSDHDAIAYEPGDLLVLDDKGFPVPFTVDQLDVAGSLEKLNYVVGRVVKVIDLNKDPDWKAGLDKVEYWPADFVPADFPGAPNGGVVDGIDVETKKGIVIQLMF